MLELLTHIHRFAETTTAEPEGIAVLGIDLKVILLQAGTFLILFFIIKKFALENIVSTLEQRRKTIDKGVDLGVEMEQKKAEFDKEVKKIHQEARAEADKIITSASKEADGIIKQGETDASKKIEQMLADAESRIDREVSKAKTHLKGEMLDLVSEATETIIGEKLDKSKDASLIDRALARMKG
ncbi:F0F1 ATP synthase subunit B [Candidatus Saccharibacteria bacterium]|nr:F0F1 ATP synthase subunit B [Candidatus Saccharibacteria bacterium]